MLRLPCYAALVVCSRLNCWTQREEVRMIKRYSFLAITTAFVILLVTGCITPGKMNEIMSSWVGDNANNLIASWGPPQQVMPDGSGGQILIYLQDRQSTSPGYSTTTSSASANAWGNYNYATATGYGTSNTVTTPPKTDRWTVSRSFWVDKDGRIYRWAWKGL